MKHYELTFLISPELNPEELISFQEKIINQVQQEKGILVKINKPVKKNLNGPVGNKNQAFLLSLEFQLNPENSANIQNKLKAENQIMRYFLIVKKPPKAAGLFEKERRVPRKTAKSKVELKEIEKKLDEILGE